MRINYKIKKMNITVIIFFCYCFVILSISHAISDKIFCYYDSRAVRRKGDGKFDVENIDPFVCTHVAYAYVGLHKTGLLTYLDPYFAVQKGAISRFAHLKTINSKLKVLISISGDRNELDKYTNVIDDSIKRKRFIETLLDLLVAYDLDGIDFAYDHLKESHFNSLAIFLQELRNKIGTHRLITLRSPAGKIYTAEIIKYIDFLNVIAYNLNDHMNGTITGFSAPLYQRKINIDDLNEQRQFGISTQPIITIDDILLDLIGHGIPTNKMLLGLSISAQTFTLASTANNDVGAPVSGPGLPGPWTQTRGRLSNAEVCAEINSNKPWIKIYNEENDQCYAYRGDQWIGYENLRSVKAKRQYAREKKLAGLMIWSIDLEDGNYNCGVNRNPLIASIWL